MNYTIIYNLIILFIIILLNYHHYIFNHLKNAIINLINIKYYQIFQFFILIHYSHFLNKNYHLISNLYFSIVLNFNF